MADKLYLYPVWLRIWHWLNALMFLMLICTGLCLQYSGYGFGLFRFDVAVTLHNIAGITITAAYLLFVILNWVTPNGKFYKVNKHGFVRRLKMQIWFYSYGIFIKAPHPFAVTKYRKFNPLQKLSYIFVMYLFMPVLIITGLALLFPEIIIPRVFGFSGIHLTGLLHIFIGFISSIFMVVHIYFCTIGHSPTKNFISMFTGWH